MKAVWIAGIALFVATVAVAQTKVSGTVQCGKADQQQSMDVADKPNHSFALMQGKCTWIKPLEIEGAKTKGAVYTGFSEATGNMIHTQGYATETLDSGDKYTVRLKATMTTKDGKPVSQRGRWSFVSGTGKLKGIKGKGTYQGKPDGDNMVSTVEGEYELPK